MGRGEATNHKQAPSRTSPSLAGRKLLIISTTFTPPFSLSTSRSSPLPLLELILELDTRVDGLGRRAVRDNSDPGSAVRDADVERPRDGFVAACISTRPSSLVAVGPAWLGEDGRMEEGTGRVRARARCSLSRASSPSAFRAADWFWFILSRAVIGVRVGWIRVTGVRGSFGQGRW